MEKKKVALTTMMLIALVLGIAVGFIFQLIGTDNAAIAWILGTPLRFLGDVFMRGIMGIVFPLILFSIVAGITSMADPKKVGRIGGRLSLLYLFSTFPAIGFAILFATILNPAGVVTYETVETFRATLPAALAADPPGIRVILTMIVPNNPFASLTGQGLGVGASAALQIIFISIALGLAINALGETAEPVRKFFAAMNDIMLKITTVFMKVAPICVFALLARTFSELRLDAIAALGLFVLTCWIALAFHKFVIYTLAIKAFVGKDPHTGKSVSIMTMFKKASPALAFAFSSASSAATLPITMRCARNLGYSREMTSLTFPAGVTLNMDGTAVFQGVAAIFLAGLFGVTLTAGQIVIVIFTATFATLGAAGVPAAGLIMLSMVLAQIGIPVEAIALIFGIDRIVDMPRTAINVFGDFIYGLIVGKREKGMIDFAQFNNPTDLAAFDAMEAEAAAAEKAAAS